MRFADHIDIYRRLGLDPNRHLPAEGLSLRVINVADDRSPPLTMMVYVTRPPREGASGHRVYAHCPCGRDIPVGRLGQHRTARVNRHYVVACDALDFACREADQSR